MFNRELFLYQVKKKLNQFRGKVISDDFDWELYNTHYRGELTGISKVHTLTLKEGDYVFNYNTLLKAEKDILPLHPNHSLLYETIAQLDPSSVFELGCGGGDHLANLSILLKNLKLYGVDLSEEQLKLLKERHPGLGAVVNQYDCTLPFPAAFPKVDIAFTQTVLMHIQTGNGHMVALSNLFNIAQKQVVLMENWTRHPFIDDIRKLHSLKVIPWKEAYFYYRDSEELKRPHLMIISAVKLPQYKELTDYALLYEGARKKGFFS